MTPSTKLLTIGTGTLRSVLFPLLFGRVFHVTRRSSFDDILPTGYVEPNDGTRKGFGASGSYARLKGYVSVFDFRSGTPEQIEVEFRKCYPTLLGDELSFLFLTPEAYAGIVENKAAREEVGFTKRWIPLIEAWHPGRLPLQNVQEVVHVSLPPDPPDSLASVLRAARLKRLGQAP